MNEEYFKQIKKLCLACGMSIDRIAKQFNINQNLVAKLFMETMNIILSEVKNGRVSGDTCSKEDKEETPMLYMQPNDT